MPKTVEEGQQRKTQTYRLAPETTKKLGDRVAKLEKKTPGITRTACVEEAVLAWLGEMERGATYLSPEEGEIVDALRSWRKNPRTVRAIHDLVKAVESSSYVAEALPGFVEMLARAARGGS